MTTRSYSDLSDSATTFDPEEQFDRDIDERMKGMTKEEAVARALLLVTAKKPASPNGVDLNVLTLDPDFDDLPQDCTEGTEDDDITQEAVILLARAAIAAADKWDADQSSAQTDASALRKQAFTMPAADQFWLASMVAENVGYVLAPEPEHPDSPHSQISPGLDSAIQEEINHGPKDIMEEGK